MAWYKMTCMHGPGHQSSISRFIKCENREYAKACLEDWVDDHDWDWPIAKFVIVKRFKAKEKQDLIKDIEHRISYYREKIQQKEEQLTRLKKRKN